MQLKVSLKVRFEHYLKVNLSFWLGKLKVHLNFSACKLKVHLSFSACKLKVRLKVHLKHAPRVYTLVRPRSSNTQCVIYAMRENSIAIAHYFWILGEVVMWEVEF